MALGPTTRRRQLGASLRALRERTGLTMEEAGARAGVSKATVSRYESSEGAVRWIVVDQLCRVYEAGDEQRDRLKELAKNSKVQGWWLPFSDDLKGTLSTYVALENDASKLDHFSNVYVPGLLQIQEYAIAAHEAQPRSVPSEVIKRQVEARMKRQEILAQPSPPHFWTILDESVLRRAVGGRDVMRSQLRHLATQAQRPNITIQILPFSHGAHAPALSSFIVLGGPDPSLDVVFVENLVGALYLEKPQELDQYRDAFNYLRAQALDTDSSVKLITEASNAFTSD
jgi:transcriptional regulator with XRE-family HTH domain